MPTCLFLRGVPGSGKNAVARLLEKDLGWPRLWVHHFDSVYRSIGEYRVPELTDKLIRDVASHLMNQKRDFLIVRPSRGTWGIECIEREAKYRGYNFVVVRLTADYDTLVKRVEGRQAESPFRLTTREALDEYLNARRDESFHGEHLIDTVDLSPAEVAGRIKELL